MIGIFDSGVGGLTVLRAIREVLPSADVLYFGDTKNAPYGIKSRTELSALTVEGLKLLQARGATNIVSACNSVSASLAISLFDALSIIPKQLIEMVGPTVGYFKGSDARLLLCATPATIHSEIYQSGFKMIGKDTECIAIQDLAGAIEIGAQNTEIDEIIRNAFAKKDTKDSDVLILGCTHYPLVLDAFRRVLGESIHVFDPAIAVAERAQHHLWPQEVGDGVTKYLVSKDSEVFRSWVAELFPGQRYSIEVIA